MDSVKASELIKQGGIIAILRGDMVITNKKELETLSRKSSTLER